MWWTHRNSKGWSMNRLVYNAIKTPDGTVLESSHRHDYQVYTDTVSGETYMIDGGLDYQRGSVNKIPAEILSVYIEDGIEKVREVLSWGTYGITGTEPLHHLVLKDMETDHIENILATQRRIHPNYRDAFNMELEYRKQCST